jgi:ParB-like chromosome segregation protein Spo0J
MAKKQKNDRINEILDDIGEMEFLTEEGARQLAASGVRVENIHVRLIRPDPAQPRRVFPEFIHQAFHEERLTASQTVRELIQYVQVVGRQNGRPFRSAMELITNPDDESDRPEPNYTPEERLLRDLVNLAVTLREDGQVNPLTVVDKSEGVAKLFQIETGERRFWASIMMMDFLPGYRGDGTIPCIIVSPEQASVFRQAKENTARSGLNAIAMARQAALLVLTTRDIHPPIGVVPLEYYRQALDKQVGRGSLGQVLTAMGGISNKHFRRYLNLLALPDDAIELADRHNIPERVLRHVLDLEPEHQFELVRQIVDYGLSARQVREIVESTGFEDVPYDPTPPSIKRIAKSLESDFDGNPDQLADYLLSQHDDYHAIHAMLSRGIEMYQRTLKNIEDNRRI